VPRVAAELEAAGLRGEVIVVDDNSPDDTADRCAALAERYSLRLLVRTAERGLSSAVIHGMHHADGDVLVVMDADLSHPPEKVPELVAAVRRGAGFVIGSRYVRGGSTAEGWGLFRWLNSKVATLLARPLCSAADPMAGFFAMPRASFVACRNRLDPVGYKIGLELLIKSGCREVREIPIDFRNRLHGTSKLTLKEQINYLRHLKLLYEFKLGRAARPLQFGLVGTTGLLIDLLCFTALSYLVPLRAARALAIWVAMSWNFYLNRRLTFSYARSRSPLTQYPLFCLSCLAGAAVNWATSIALHGSFTLFEQWPSLAAVVGVVAGTGFNYLFSAKLVFRRGGKAQANHAAQPEAPQRQVEPAQSAA
jgi:dolichol-phosphate mannosyltransferase